MKKNKLAIIGATTILLGSFTGISTNVFADSQTKNDISVKDIKPIANSFPDVGMGIYWLANYYDLYLKEISKPNTLDNYRVGKSPTARDLEVKTAYGELTTEPQVISTNPLWAGESTLTNNTSQQQTLYSSVFRKSFTNTTSSATTNGFMLGTEVKGKVGIPFVAEGEVTLKAEYNFSDTQTNEISETIEYEAPAQPIDVPAHTTAVVRAVLETKKIKGTMNLYSDIGINKEVYGFNDLALTNVKQGIKVVPLGSIYDEAMKQAIKNGANNVPELAALSRSSLNPNYIAAKGQGSFESQYGTVFKVQVDFLNAKTKKVVSSRSFEVKPKINK